MFVQIIQGRVKDPALLHRQIEQWRREIKPGATGYLGSTSGVSSDGRAIVLVRFESEEAARANSSRPEQGAWWARTESAFEGAPEFHDCGEVDTLFGGGSDAAGFVQVIQAGAADKAGMRQLIGEMDTRLRQLRPDILGISVCWHDDGGVTQAVYFSSEEEARRGEKETEGDELRRRYVSMFVGELTFFDLSEPDLD